MYIYIYTDLHIHIYIGLRLWLCHARCAVTWSDWPKMIPVSVKRILLGKQTNGKISCQNAKSWGG